MVRGRRNEWNSRIESSCFINLCFSNRWKTFPHIEQENVMQNCIYYFALRRLSLCFLSFPWLILVLAYVIDTCVFPLVFPPDMSPYFTRVGLVTWTEICYSLFELIYWRRQIVFLYRKITYYWATFHSHPTSPLINHFFSKYHLWKICFILTEWD